MPFRNIFKAQTHDTFGLTSLGKEKAEKFTSTNADSMILNHLNENGVSTISEISQDLRTSPQKVKMVVRSLMRRGYVRKVNSEE